MKRNIRPWYLALLAAIAAPASALHVNPQGTGSVLLFPYFTVNAGQQTVLSIVNTSARAKILKAEFREGYNSRVVLDFNIVLAPHDTWTATVFAQDTGDARILTRDESCTAPDKPQWTGPYPGGGYQQTFLDFAYTGDHADTGPTGPARRREGFFNVIELAELDGALAAAVVGQHPPNCAPLQAINPLSPDLRPPGGGVHGDFAVVDVAEGTLFGGRATAIDDYSQHPLFADTASLLQYIALGNSRPGEVDAVLPAGASGTTLTYSSTSPLGPSPWYAGARAMDAALMSDSVFGAMSREASVSSHTEWVVTMPTKYFYTDNEMLGLSLGEDGALPPFDTVFGASRPGASCSRYTAQGYDREGRAVQFLTDPEFPTPPPWQLPQHALCFAANVVHFSDLDPDGTTPLLGSRLGSKLWNPVPAVETANVRIDLGTRPATGAPRLLPPDIRGTQLRGLPLIGFEAVRYVNGNVKPGTLANYTLATPLRGSVVCARASGEPRPCR